MPAEKRGPAPPAQGRPAPPAQGRPAPPAQGRPAPPAQGRPAPPASPTGSSNNTNTGGLKNNLSSVILRAIELEESKEFSDAAILYRSSGLVADENRCLQLALNKSQEQKTTIINHGDRIIQDSVIMNQDD
jgi:hypothetical protein